MEVLEMKRKEKNFFALVGLGLFAFALSERNREPNPGRYSKKKVPIYTVGIETFKMNQVAERQYLSHWCWAASIESIFNYYGHPISQIRIVQEIFGEIVNLPADISVILRSLNRVWVDDYGVPFRVKADLNSATHLTIFEDLNRKQPLLIGSLSHAVVLTAMNYVPANPEPIITDWIVRDPSPNRPSRRVLTQDEWDNLSMVARIRVLS
jgi:Papain-like cysteine protease AvrRpt2